MKQSKHLVLALLAVALAGVANAEYVVGSKLVSNRSSALLPDSVHDLALAGIIAPGLAVGPGVPLNPRVLLVNVGASSESGIPVHLTIDSLGSQVYNATFTVPILASGESVTVVFPAWTPAAAGDSYRVTTWHSYTPDTDRLNDTLRRTVKVVGPPSVSVTAPNGGESWQAGTVHNITWTSANSTFDSVSYSTNGGGSWRFVVGQSPPTHTYSWAVPNTPSANCLVKVTAIGDSMVEDQSDSVFAIVPADTTWIPQSPIPLGPRRKTVKAGGCIAADQATGNLYLLKGNGTCEFYHYDAARDTWYAGDSIPATDPDGKQRKVKKGASMAVAGGKVYVLKGGNSTEYWRYDPGVCAAGGAWSPVAPVPNLKYSTQASDTADHAYILGYASKSKTTLFLRYTTPNGPTLNLSSPAPNTPRKTFSTGSCIVYFPDDESFGVSRIFALQFTTNDFYSYDIGADRWTWLNRNMPFTWPGTNTRKKVGAGAGMAYAAVNNTIYALKGGKTQELWAYTVVGGWNAFDTVPRSPSGKKVGDGGGITCASGVLHIVKGNNTQDNYYMQLSFWKDQVRTPGAEPQSAGSDAASALELAVTPNPVARDARVSFSLPRAGNAQLKLYDVTGKLVSTLVSGYRAAGSCNTGLSAVGCKLSSGVYLLSLDAEGSTVTRKIIIE